MRRQRLRLDASRRRSEASVVSHEQPLARARDESEQQLNGEEDDGDRAVDRVVATALWVGAVADRTDPREAEDGNAADDAVSFIRLDRPGRQPQRKLQCKLPAQDTEPASANRGGQCEGESILAGRAATRHGAAYEEERDDGDDETRNVVPGSVVPGVGDRWKVWELRAVSNLDAHRSITGNTRQ